MSKEELAELDNQAESLKSKIRNAFESHNESAISDLHKELSSVYNQARQLRSSLGMPSTDSRLFVDDLKAAHDLMEEAIEVDFVPVEFWHLIDESFYRVQQCMCTYAHHYAEFKARGDQGLLDLYNGIKTGEIDLLTQKDLLSEA